MNKMELIEAVAKALDTSKAHAGEIVDLFFSTEGLIAKELKKGGAEGATHTVTGNLKIRGVEKSVTFPAKITIGKDSIKTTADFKINRKDWGINYAGSLAWVGVGLLAAGLPVYGLSLLAGSTTLISAL